MRSVSELALENPSPSSCAGRTPAGLAGQRGAAGAGTPDTLQLLVAAQSAGPDLSQFQENKDMKHS